MGLFANKPGSSQATPPAAAPPAGLFGNAPSAPGGGLFGNQGAGSGGGLFQQPPAGNP